MAPKVTSTYKVKKKQQLLLAAREVFLSKGYTNATIQDIIDIAGVSRGTIYNYFKNIDHAFVEVLYNDDQYLLPNIQIDSRKSVWQQLTFWIEQLVDIHTNQPSLVQARSEFFLSSNYVNNKEHFSYIKKRYEVMVEGIKRTIQQGKDAGQLNPVTDGDTIAHYLISFMDGMILNTDLLGSQVTSMEKQIDFFLESLKTLLCPIVQTPQK
ncbi:TetR family transcriptional regulator [Virgibacillus sp. AGTR]|uniref:TetR/AcrR family transcriptional regulator n=1 Tax=Virgibacillus sp. AGTR TaxID=2812055 RepID=UPI001962F277|nr:TetR family transcriptional regulator [Virgibacillus sp. AGTR]MCC2251703.1 TetR family transcriptional regulator [Virgibacillus sp. AGTR]QRZ19427.1 TetR family transcriptional regulator [Virgibacillus sp. AGTR]